MKLKYFRVPWHRLRVSQQSIARTVKREEEDVVDQVQDDRVKRKTARMMIKEVMKCARIL